jgi:hypothetical protein
MEEAPEPIKVLYKLHEVSTKGLAEQGYSEEEAFWFGFAVTCCYIWDPNAEVEINLSEIFRLYLTIYCEKMNPEMKVKEEARFIELLKEKYKQIRQIVLEIEDPYESTMKLGEIIHKEKLNVIKQALTADGVLSYAQATVPMPFKLIKDI